MDVAGKAALVTGGGTGVGRATALKLAEMGCSVMVNYSRSQDEAEKTAAEAKSKGVKAIPFKADVSKDEECRAMVDTAVKELGRLDILVNNAGTTRRVALDDLEGITDEDWDTIMGVNLKGTFQCTRAARPALEASGNAEIVNVSSVAGVAGTGSSVVYCASKAGVNNMTKVLGRVLGPKIRVNAIAPGFITGRWLQYWLGEEYEPFMKAVSDRAPLKGVCDPEDVADAIISVITGSDMVTGQTIVCDGGVLIAG